MARYFYQRTGGPLLSWKNAPPQQTRSASTKALGGYEDFPGGQLLQIAGAKVGQASGLGCNGCGSSSKAMQGFGSLAGTSLDGPTISMPLPRAGAPEPLPSLGAVPALNATNLAIGAGVAFALYSIFGKKRR